MRRYRQNTSKLFWQVYRRSLVLLSFASSLLESSGQINFNVDSSLSTRAKVYQWNNGMNLLSDKELEAGLVFPRDSLHGFVVGSGVWIGAKLKFDNNSTLVPRVLKTYDPVVSASMCIPGNYVNGNRYRPDLSDSFTIKRTITDGVESLYSSFHDGDLRFYPFGLDSSIWKAYGFPLGFQFYQEMTVMDVAKDVFVTLVNTKVSHVGAAVLDSVFIGYITDVAIGPGDRADVADANDYCVVSDKETNVPFAILGDSSDSGSEYGSIGIAVLYNSLGRQTHTIQVIKRSMIDSIDMHVYNYRYLSSGIQDDTLETGDKVVIHSVDVGQLLQGDTFAFTMIFVVTTSKTIDARAVIRETIEMVRYQHTGIREIESNLGNPDIMVVLNDQVDVSKTCLAQYDQLNAMSVLGEIISLRCNNGILGVRNLASGMYTILATNKWSGCSITMLVTR